MYLSESKLQEITNRFHYESAAEGATEASASRRPGRGGTRKKGAPAGPPGPAPAADVADQPGSLAKTRRLFAKNSPEWIAKRCERMKATSKDQHVREELAAASESQQIETLERIFGRDDMMRLDFFSDGLNAARAVGRIRIVSSSGAISGFGTGFLIAPRLLITNHHVIGTPDEAATSFVEFKYEDNDDGSIPPPSIRKLRPDLFFLTDDPLDYTITAVEGDDLESLFGFLPLIEAEGKVLIGEFVNIIQHPMGGAKRVALRANQIEALFPQFIHYSTDTSPGSSGSPVFNDQWEVVGLHHSGVPQRDEQGRIVTIDGVPFQTGMAESRIKWITNEGIRANHLVQSIRAKSAALEEEKRRLVDLVVNQRDARSSLPPEIMTQAPASDAVAQRFTQTPVAESDTAIFTIPLRVKVRLGGPVLSVLAGTPSAGAGIPSSSFSTTGADDGSTALRTLAEARTALYFDDATDKTERDDYYREIDQAAIGSVLYTSLSDLLRSTHRTSLAFKPTTFLYPEVELREDGNLVSIYSGASIDPTEAILADLAAERDFEPSKAGLRRQDSGEPETGHAGKVAATQSIQTLRTEHAVPPSWFEQRSPMLGDLHHLFVCEPECRGLRAEKTYFEFGPTDSPSQSECGRIENNLFEPAAGKGELSRATLYFLIRYPGVIRGTATQYTIDRINLLKQWCREYQVTLHEKHRNRAIFLKQGNRNPLIDFPELVDRIDFNRGLGR
jgi:endonuclease I/V8-like Glu-specific endopeptidase